MLHVYCDTSADVIQSLSKINTVTDDNILHAIAMVNSTRSKWTNASIVKLRMIHVSNFDSIIIHIGSHDGPPVEYTCTTMNRIYAWFYKHFKYYIYNDDDTILLDCIDA